MKAISLWQPWASLVVAGHKRIETRHWQPPRSVLGKRIAIHAALMRSHDALAAQPPFDVLGIDPFALPHGCIVGTVKLSSCVRMTPTNIEDFEQRRPLEIAFGNWQPGRYAWVLREPRLFETPLPLKGSQGFFNVDLTKLRGTIPA